MSSVFSLLPTTCPSLPRWDPFRAPPKPQPPLSPIGSHLDSPLTSFPLLLPGSSPGPGSPAHTSFHLFPRPTFCLTFHFQPPHFPILLVSLGTWYSTYLKPHHAPTLTPSPLRFCPLPPLFLPTFSGENSPLPRICFNTLVPLPFYLCPLFPGYCCFQPQTHLSHFSSGISSLSPC